MDPESEPGHEPEPLARTSTGRRLDLRAARPSWGFVAALVLVVVVAALAVDGRARAREDAALAGCRRALTLATDDAEQRLGLVAHYLQPPLTSDGRVQSLHLADLMSARAGAALPRVQDAERTCAGVRIEPWHFAQVRRQSADTAYAAALVTLVQTLTAQGSTPFRDDGVLQRLRDEVGVG